MPEINAWESEKFRAKQQTMAFNLLYGFLPDNTFTADELREVSSVGSGGDIDVNQKEQIAKEQEMQNIIQTNDEGKIYFLNTGISYVESIPGQQGVELVKDYMNKTVNAIRTQSTKRGDDRIKRFYSDLADVFNPEEANNYSQMYFTSPYLPGLEGCFIQLVNPVGVSSKELKSQLTVPLYNASFDFAHAVAEEIKTEYGIQNYFNNNPNRNNYDVEKFQINRIYDAHKNILKQYAKLREFQDDPEGQTRKYMQNSLSHIFGRDKGGGNLYAYIGMIRGENQAIDNGWGIDDRYVLGALGGIEAEIKYQEEYGTPEVKAGLLEFKAKFYELKDSCYYKSVNSAEERLAITGRVKAFAEAAMGPNATPAEKACCVSVTNTIKKFDAIEEAINKRINFELQNEREKVEERKNTNPDGYIRFIYEQALARKDFKQFVLEYIDVKNKVESSFGVNDPTRRKFENTMRTLLSEENEYSLPIRKSITELYFEKKVQYGQMLEQKAAEVRAGKVNIRAVLPEIVSMEKGNEELEFDINNKLRVLRQDPLFAKRIANRLLKGSEVNKNLLELGQLYDDCNIDVTHINDVKKIKKNYLQNARDGLTTSERLTYYKNGNEHSTSLENTYGMKHHMFYDSDLSLPKVDNIVSTIRTERRNIDNYLEDFYKLHEGAIRRLNELNKLAEGRKNSQAFNNMLTALKNVTTLTVEDTPNKLNETILNLGKASKAYEDKINAQTFAAILENGQNRKVMSIEFQRFSRNAINRFANDLPENMEANESMISQQLRAIDVEKSLHNCYKVEIKQKISTKINDTCLKLKPYDAQLSLEENKDYFSKQMANVLFLDSLDKKADKCLVSSNEYSDNVLADNYYELSADDAFILLKDSINSEQDYNRLYDMTKNNPRLLIAEFNAHRQHLNEKKNDVNDAYDNEYISKPKEKSNELKNPSKQLNDNQIIMP